MSGRLLVPLLLVLINPISALLELPALAQDVSTNPSVTPTGSLRWARHDHTATLLATGQVLVVGGGGVKCIYYGPLIYFCATSVNDTAELYDPSTDSWRLTGTTSRRTQHSATLLPDGQVLTVAGVSKGWDIGLVSGERLQTAELYDPVSENWRPTRGPNALRGQNDAVLLPSGNVLVVGKDSGDQSVAELFDPSTETWSPTRAPSLSRHGFELRGPMTLLPGGKVLSGYGGSAELYDPETETWSSAGSFNSIGHVGTMTVLQNGQVLAIGRRSDWSEVTAELYDPTTQAWRLTGPLNYGSPTYACTCSVGTATLLSNGQVLLAGGWDEADLSPSTPSPVELFDPRSETWKTMPHLSLRREGHTATLLHNDKVLLASGLSDNYQFPIFHISAELFDLGLPRPTSLSISLEAVTRGQCFTMTVVNGSNMILDVQYRLAGGPVQTLKGWPKLDENGRAEKICTSLQTPIGTIEFTAIRNTETRQWLPISTSVTVREQ